MKGYTELLRTKVTALESIIVCVCFLCSKAFPNGTCLEALLRITGAAAVYFTRYFLRQYHSAIMRISHMLVWFLTCIPF